ncbi:hypothetical protein [Cohaesibacter haloalkalitolerans]|uniref:hypothetical protein n=1 Tax=Cohaesibacter haloalkalitolerans TaxID=1162980 RepID=UPI0013C4C509|nr:hypothetical protein [Cohaesibacter haloalkalitolerans]
MAYKNTAFQPLFCIRSRSFTRIAKQSESCADCARWNVSIPLMLLLARMASLVVDWNCSSFLVGWKGSLLPPEDTLSAAGFSGCLSGEMLRQAKPLFLPFWFMEVGKPQLKATQADFKGNVRSCYIDFYKNCKFFINFCCLCLFGHVTTYPIFKIFAHWLVFNSQICQQVYVKEDLDCLGGLCCCFVEFWQWCC